MTEGQRVESVRAPSLLRRIPGWGLVAIAFIGFFGLLIAVLLVLVTVAPAPRPGTASSLGSQTMPDGTVLVLEAVTVGTRHRFDHQWSPPAEPFDWLVGKGIVKYTEDESTASERQMLWFTRRDAKTGQQLDFDWWEKCIAIDERGWEIEDEDVGRDSRTAHGSSGYGGSRPLPPLPAEPYRAIVAHSSLPRFRCSAPTFRLQVFGKGHALVAEFGVPTASIGPIPEWTPESLPATKTDRDLSVTLTGLHGRPHQFKTNPSRFYLEPRFEVRRNGELTSDWSSLEMNLTDALGSTSGTWECRLNPFESAWKLNVRLFRPPTSTFEPSEQIVVENIEIPAVGNVRALTESLTLGPVTLELQAVGNGKVVYTETLPGGRSSGTSSTEGTTGEKNERYRIEQVDRGAVRTTTVDTTVPHVRYRLTGLDGNHRFHLRIIDDQGKEVPTNPSTMGEAHYHLLPGAAGMKSIKVVAVVHEGRAVEFVVAPPEEFRAAPTKGDEGGR